MKKLAVFAVVLAFASCDDDANVHILTGQLYVPGAQCLEPSTGFDVASGGDVSDSCGPTCLEVPAGEDGDGGAITYITTICGPFPPPYVVEAEDATTGTSDPCVPAFAAYNNPDAECPSTLDEGGTDAADAGRDATIEAGMDAATEASADGGVEAAVEAGLDAGVDAPAEASASDM